MKYSNHLDYFCHEKKDDFPFALRGDVIISDLCTDKKSLKGEALQLLEYGFPILPLHHPTSEGFCSCNNRHCPSPGKHPLTKNGVKDSTRDRGAVLSWWDRFPMANLGIATGKVSELCVIDIDLKNSGFESLKNLEEQTGRLPESLRVKTGGGGLHIFFKTSLEVRNRVNLLKGIDVRGEGGYVVAPPSCHISGRRYEWINQAEILPLPESLLALVQNRSNRSFSSDSVVASEGQRNQTLASIAGFLRTKGLDNRQLEAILIAANGAVCTPNLDLAEVEKIAASMAKYPPEQNHPWRTATSLPKNLFKIEHLAPEHIPPSLREWIVDLAERMQLPLEFIAAPAIVSAASVIGRKVGVRPLQHDDWTVIPNLWGFLVSEPGSMKSPGIAAAIKPLDILQREALKQFQNSCREAQKSERDLQREIDAIQQALKIDLRSGFVSDFASKRNLLGELQEKQADKKLITEKRYKTNDPTVEKLALILKENPQGILLLRDELSGWLESLAKNGREGNREFYLEAWDGNNSYTIDRIGRGTTHVDALCVSVFGGIQPDKLEKYINKTINKDGDDGFLERFQVVVYPKKLKVWNLVDRGPNAEAEKTAFETFKFLDHIKGPIEVLQFMRFSSDSQRIADEWRIILEKRLLEEDCSPIFKAHLSKYRSLMPSLALIFTLMAAARGNMMPPHIDLESTQMALAWCRILETHIRRIYQKTLHDPFYGARILAKKILAKQVSDREKLRDICRRNWRGLKTAEQLEGAISKLSEFNWVRIEALQTSGGRSEIIRINPSLPQEVEL